MFPCLPTKTNNTRKEEEKVKVKMKGTSKVIMGATLVMVVTLAIVIALILVLLAELYCSLLLRRRHHLRNTTTTQTTTQTTRPTASPSHAPHSPPQHPPPPPPPPPPIYAPGVLQAPRSFLFPCMKEDIVIKEPNNHHHSELLHKVIHIQTQESNSNVFVSSPPILISPFMSRAPPQKDTPHHEGTSVSEIPSSCNEREQLVYISNPIYENEEGKASGVNTPFETPDTSPSRLESSGSSGNDDDDDDHCDGAGVHSPTYTPPLTPMKKLPAEASSVSLRDARSLGTSASDSRSTVNGPSSSSSDSPCTTSPSW